MRKALFIVALSLLIMILAGAIWAACPSRVPCPTHDNSTTYFTGTQKFENNHYWYLYHCTEGGTNHEGHDFWVRCD